MASGYVRQAAADISAGLPINAEDFNAEYDQLQSAFDNTVGHDHTGSTSGDGALIPLTAGVSGTLPVANGGTGITSEGTTTTLLHGNASGDWSFSAVDLTADVANTLPVANGGTGITTEGTTTTVLHGNASGAWSFSAVSLTADVSGILPIANGGSGNANGKYTIPIRVVANTGAQAMTVADGLIVWQPTSPATATFTLPANPAAGDTYGFKYLAASASGIYYLMGITASGMTVEGQSTLYFNVPNTYVELVYIGSNLWIIK